MEAEGLVKGQESICFIVMSKNAENKFKHFKQLYQNNRFDILLKEPGSNYWLKLRSISRKELLKEFCVFADLSSENAENRDLFEFIYEANPPETLLNKFIAQKYQAERIIRKANEKKLVSELFKMKVFDWGGLYQNNLERTIVDNYVKKIQDLNRGLYAEEYQQVVDEMERLGFRKGYFQNMESPSYYQPDFSKKHPFE